MILSYCNDILGDGKRHSVEAVVTTEHNASSYGQPVILVDGEPIDTFSWVACQYAVEEATPEELAEVNKIIGAIGLSTL